MLIRPGFGFGRAVSSALAGAVLPSLDLDFMTGAVPPGLQLSRSSAALYMTASGAYASAAANIARLEYHPVTRAPMGLLVEESVIAKNLYARPSGNLVSDFGATETGLSTATDADNPARDLGGGTTVWKLDNSAGGSAVSISWAGTCGNTSKHSLQLWARVSAGSGFTLGLNDTGATIFGHGGNTWQRVTVSNITPPSSSARMKLTVPAGACIYFTLANLQENIFSTSPVDTAGTAAARAADRYKYAYGAWFSTGAGTFVVDHCKASQVTRSVNVLLHIGDSSNQNRFMINHEANGAKVWFSKAGGATTVFYTAPTGVTTEGPARDVLAYTGTTQTGASNGSILVVETMSAFPSSFAFGLGIGSNLNSSAQEYTGHIRRITYYKKAFTNDMLRRLSRYPGRVPGVVASDTLDLFLFAGQSNASGRGLVGEAPVYTNQPRMFLLGNDDVMKPYADPFDDNANQRDSVSVETSGPGFSAAGPLLDLLATGRNIAAVPAAKGNTALADWQPGALTDPQLYLSMRRRAMLARNHGRLRALVWHQGENDALGTTQGDYQAALSQLIARFRADLEDALFPVVIVGLHDMPGSGSYPTWDAIRTAQQNVAASLPKTAFVDARGCGVIAGDAVHLSTAGMVTLAGRIKTALDTLL